MSRESETPSIDDLILNVSTRCVKCSGYAYILYLDGKHYVYDITNSTVFLHCASCVTQSQPQRLALKLLSSQPYRFST